VPVISASVPRGSPEAMKYGITCVSLHVYV
jgi:hypothetical protein